MLYRVILNDPDESSVMAETVEVEADREPDFTSHPNFVVFTGNGTPGFGAHHVPGV